MLPETGLRTSTDLEASEGHAADGSFGAHRLPRHSGCPSPQRLREQVMIYVSAMPSSTVVSLFGALALFISSVTAASFVKCFARCS